MPKELKYKFKVSPDYQRISATGAWGGVSPQGEIIFDLTLDSYANPDSLEMTIVDGKETNEIRTGFDGIIREAQVGVVLRPDIAYSIGKWLIQKAKEAGVKEIPDSNTEKTADKSSH